MKNKLKHDFNKFQTKINFLYNPKTYQKKNKNFLKMFFQLMVF